MQVDCLQEWRYDCVIADCASTLSACTTACEAAAAVEAGTGMGACKAATAAGEIALGKKDCVAAAAAGKYVPGTKGGWAAAAEVQPPLGRALAPAAAAAAVLSPLGRAAAAAVYSPLGPATAAADAAAGKIVPGTTSGEAAPAATAAVCSTVV